MILSEGDTFSVDETWLKREPVRSRQFSPVPLNGALLRQEKEMIEAALAESQGRISGPTGAAAKLGLPRGPSTRKSSAWKSINIDSRFRRLDDLNAGAGIDGAFLTKQEFLTIQDGTVVLSRIPSAKR